MCTYKAQSMYTNRCYAMHISLRIVSHNELYYINFTWLLHETFAIIIISDMQDFPIQFIQTPRDYQGTKTCSIVSVDIGIQLYIRQNQINIIGMLTHERVASCETIPFVVSLLLSIGLNRAKINVNFLLCVRQNPKTLFIHVDYFVPGAIVNSVAFVLQSSQPLNKDCSNNRVNTQQKFTLNLFSLRFEHAKKRVSPFYFLLEKTDKLAIKHNFLKILTFDST